MVRKLAYLLLLPLCTTGCTTYDEGTDFPEKRLLGNTLPEYRAEQSSEPKFTQIEDINVPDVLTHQNALALAMLHNPQLQVFAWSVRKAQAQRLQAGLWPNPELDIEMENVGGTGPFQGTDGAETTVAIEQLLETAGKRAKRTKVAKLNSRLVGWDFETKRLEVLTEASLAFWTVVAAQEAIAVIEQQVQLSEQMLEAVEHRVQAGNDSPLEATKARVSLTQVRIEHKRLVRELSASRLTLAAMWGDDRVLFSRAAGTLDSLLSPPDENTISSLIEHHPSIARWDVEIEQRRAHIDLEKANAVLDPTVLGGYRRFNDLDESAFVLGLSLPLPVTNRNQGNIAAAKVSLVQTRSQRKAAFTGLRAELGQTYSDMSSAYSAALDLRGAVLPGAQEAFDLAQTGYQSGKFDYLTVLDAQRTLFEVRTQYITVLADYHQSKTKLEHLIGQPIVKGLVQTKGHMNKQEPLNQK